MLPPNSKEEKQEFFNWKNFLIWILLALIIRWQIIEPRWIPSGSMLPTLQVQDKILIEKIRPRLLKKLHHNLNYDEIIVFSPPQSLIDSGYDSRSDLIKRLVGLPGDTIEVSGGNLIRNQELINEPWLNGEIQYEMNPVKVPEHQIWVLGDNRNNSLDSHIWGPLPEEKIVGTAIFRYWPLQNLGPIRFPTPNKIGDKDPVKVRFNT